MSIYLDHHTTTRPLPEVIDAMQPYFREEWGSPFAPHRFGLSLHEPLQIAMRSLYDLVGAQKEDHFVFTSSGAEAVNHVVFAAYLDIARKTGKNHFVTSTIDEAPQMMAMQRLSELGCVYELAVAKKPGVVTAEAISEAITPRTAMVSLSWANGITGLINPLKEISNLCKERGILFHVEATHVLGKGYFPWEDSGADLLTFNGEQFYGPKGTGGLFIRAGLNISPLILGGNEQGGLRGGNLNIPGFIGLGKAATLAAEAADFFCTEVARLRNLFEELLIEHIPNCLIYFRNEQRLPNTVVADFPGAASDALLYLLNRKGVYGSLGGGHFQQISHLLLGSGIQTLSALSFALSRETTETDIKKAVEKIKEAYERLSRCSHHLMENQ